MSDVISVEQLARDMLDRMGVDDAQEWTAGRLVELANLISKADALKAKDQRIAELEADVARLREQRDSLQAKVHLCTAYDYLEKRCAELESALQRMVDGYMGYDDDIKFAKAALKGAG